MVSFAEKDWDYSNLSPNELESFDRALDFAQLIIDSESRIAELRLSTGSLVPSLVNAARDNQRNSRLALEKLMPVRISFLEPGKMTLDMYLFYRGETELAEAPYTKEEYFYALKKLNGEAGQ